MGRELALVIPLYVLLSLVFTWPLVLNFGQYVVGDLESDVWKHLWGMWWVKTCLVRDNVLPLHTHLLNYPYGGALFFIDPLNGLISTPLQFLWDAPRVYNLVVLFNVVLAAVGAFCLARYLSGSPYAAFFAGSVYGFSSYMMAYLTSGVTEAINIGWIPLFCLFFIRMLRHNQLADAVRAGTWFAVATVGCWYYGSFCVLFGTFYYVYAQARRYRRPLRLLLGRVASALRLPWSATVRSVLVLLLLAAVVVWRLPTLLDPFHGSGLDFVLVAAVLSLMVHRALVLRGGVGPRSSAIGRALWQVTPALALVLAEIWLVSLALARVSTWSQASLFVVLAQALVVTVGACRVLARRRQHLRTLRDLLAPHSSFLVSLGLLILCSAAILVGLSYLGQRGAEWVVGSAVLVVAMASSLVLRHARMPQEGEEADLLADYRRFFATHAGWLLFLALGSVPALRLLLPEVPLLPFLATWFSAQVLLQLGLAGLLALVRLGDRTLREERVDRFQELAGGVWTHALRGPVVMALVATVLVSGPAWEFRRTINSEESLVYRKREAGNVDLHLSLRFLNVVRLVDYVRPGKSHATRSYTVDKLTRVAYAGWVTLAVVGVGLVAGIRRRQTGLWVFMALAFVMFSLGPFVYFSDQIYTEIRSPIYMAFFNYFPFFSQVSIPYRFTAMVMLSLSILAALALAGLGRRWARRDQALLSAALTLAMLFDVTLLSPAPFPLPLSSSTVPEYCTRLAQDPQEWGLLDYPIQRYRGELLPGEYFFYQMTHGKAMPNRVEGTIPFFVYQNSFANYLFMMEHAREDLPPRDRRTLERGLEDLSRFGFRYIVLHDNYLRSAARERMHTLLRFFLGEPEAWPDGVWIYRVTAGKRDLEEKPALPKEEAPPLRGNKGPQHE